MGSPSWEMDVDGRGAGQSERRAEDFFEKLQRAGSNEHLSKGSRQSAKREAVTQHTGTEKQQIEATKQLAETTKQPKEAGN